MSDFFVVSNDAIPNTASPAPIVSTGFNSNALVKHFFYLMWSYFYIHIFQNFLLYNKILEINQII